MTPPVAWAALGIVLINQDAFVDPWYYVGYGRAFGLLHAEFGWTYYAVRFPVMMLNQLALSGSHPLVGYALLRYALVLLCGIPLYLWARRELGRPAAMLGYLFLFCSPLLPRIILWDLTTFISVPMALAAFGTWLLSGRAPWRMLSGFLMMASIASHAFTGTAVGTFLIVQALRRLRARDIRGLLLNDIAATGLGAVACFGVGCVYYLVRVGPFNPMVLVTATAEAVGLGTTYVVTHATPYSLWAAREYHIYVPALFVVMSGVLLGRRVFENTAVASVWWFAAAYTAFFTAYQFILGFVLETFYYFAHLTPVVFLLVPIVVGEFARARQGRARTRVVAAGMIGLLVLPALNRLVPDLWPRMNEIALSNAMVLAALLVVSALIIASARFAVTKAAGPVVLCLFLICVQALVMLNETHRRVFDSRYRVRERGVYVAAIEMLDVVERFSRGGRVIPWYCPTQYSVASLSSTVLRYSLSDPLSVQPCEARMGNYELSQLAEDPRYVLMMNEHPEMFPAEDAALRSAGYRVDERLAKTIGDDGYHVTIRMVEITSDVK